MIHDIFYAKMYLDELREKFMSAKEIIEQYYLDVLLYPGTMVYQGMYDLDNCSMQQELEKLYDKVYNKC